MVLCKICKSSGKQGEVFLVEDFDNLDNAICVKCIQPERSKREDGINTLRCGNCEKEYDIFLDPNHAYRCGALNSMET